MNISKKGKTPLEHVRECVDYTLSNDDDKYFEHCDYIAAQLPKDLFAPLRQLIDGPVSDGDLISATARNELVEAGLAVFVCCDGSDGYTGAKPIAKVVLHSAMRHLGLRG